MHEPEAANEPVPEFNVPVSLHFVTRTQIGLYVIHFNVLKPILQFTTAVNNLLKAIRSKRQLKLSENTPAE